MSLVTQVIEGKIAPDVFIEEAAADLKKDLGIFGSPLFITWAVGALEAVLTASGKLSPTLVSLIGSEIESVLGAAPGTAPAITPAGAP